MTGGQIVGWAVFAVLVAAVTGGLIVRVLVRVVARGVLAELRRLGATGAPEGCRLAAVVDAEVQRRARSEPGSANLPDFPSPPDSGAARFLA